MQAASVSAYASIVRSVHQINNLGFEVDAGGQRHLETVKVVSPDRPLSLVFYILISYWLGTIRFGMLEVISCLLKTHNCQLFWYFPLLLLEKILWDMTTRASWFFTNYELR